MTEHLNPYEAPIPLREPNHKKLMTLCSDLQNNNFVSHLYLCLINDGYLLLMIPVY